MLHCSSPPFSCLAKPTSISNMDDSEILEKDRIIKNMGRGFINGKSDLNFGGFANVLKLFLLKNVGHGAGTLFLPPKSRQTNARRTCSCGRVWDEDGNEVVETINKSGFSSQENQKVCEEPEIRAYQANLIPYESAIQRKGAYDEFPLNFITFLAVVLIKSLGFQINLLVTFLTLPLYLSYFWFTMMMFPFQTLKHVRRYLMKQATRKLDALSSRVSSSVCARISAPKSVVKMGVRMSRAFLWSIYVWCVLMGLLVSGFVISTFLIRSIVEAPVHATRELNFDYTKASPAAFVPMMSHSLSGDDNLKSAEARAVPYDHNLHITVSLTLPESEYNRKLGVFQVKVEFLSTNGKVTATQSHPCILRYKSRPIRHIQTFVMAAPLLVGFESESQTLQVKMGEFTEGLEPTACLKVSLVQRAEFQPGTGIPEIHAAAVAIESELPQVKRMIWGWRRTVIVWTGFVVFSMELVVMLVMWRAIIIPGGRKKVQASGRLVGTKEDCQPKTIAWYKGSLLMMMMTS